MAIHGKCPLLPDSHRASRQNSSLTGWFDQAQQSHKHVHNYFEKETTLLDLMGTLVNYAGAFFVAGKDHFSGCLDKFYFLKQYFFQAPSNVKPRDVYSSCGVHEIIEY